MSNPDPLLGTYLGQYRLDKLLGKGGMASVYLATQENINRVVAVKILPRSFMHDDSFMQRFRLEARTIASLEHVHILPIYDYGEQDGAPYIVMRYLEGGTLEDRIRRDGPLPWEDILRIAKQVGQALDYAHNSGVIHRDIKPSNIMLDRGGNVYLADFGIARILEGTAALTGSGVVGTPSYMAPEQADGSPPTPTMDVYALGVTTFEMIAGRLPFIADTPIAQIMMHINKPVPLLNSMNPAVPPEVDAVIQKALAKNPAERYSHASEFATALEAAAHSAGGWNWAAATLAMDLKPEGVTVPAAERPVSEPLSSPPGQASARPRGRARGGIRTLVIAGVALGLVATVGAGLLLLSQVASRTQTASVQTTQTALALSAQAVVIDEPLATATEPLATATTESSEPVITDAPTATSAPTATETPFVLQPTTTLRGVTMVLVPEGSFIMGSNAGYPHERPEREVMLDAFYIDETEVTNLFYKACVDAGACAEPVFINSPSQVAYWGLEFYFDYPLIYATWSEADTYCRWRGGHLPTEAQWEKAARFDPVTGESYMFPWGLDVLDPYYLNFNNLRGETVKVKTFPQGRSPVGAYEMAGNIAEWINDWYQDNYYEQGPAQNPSGPTEGQFKVVRGGSYQSQGSALTTTFREYISPGTQSPLIGFRCAFTPGGDPTPQGQ